MITLQENDGSIKFSSIAATHGKGETEDIRLSDYYRGAKVFDISANFSVPTSGAIKVSSLANSIRAKDFYSIQPIGTNTWNADEESISYQDSSQSNFLKAKYPGYTLGILRHLGSSFFNVTNASVTYANGGTSGLTQIYGDTVDTPNLGGDNNTGVWDVTCPFTFQFLGRDCSRILINSNSFMSFLPDDTGTTISGDDPWVRKLENIGSSQYVGNFTFDYSISSGSLTSSPYPKNIRREQGVIPRFGIGVNSFDYYMGINDRSAQAYAIKNYHASAERIWAGVTGTAGSRIYRIRFEGTVQALDANSLFNNFGGTPGSPNVIWEVKFYEATPDRIDIHNVANSARTTTHPFYSISIFDEFGHNVPLDSTLTMPAILSSYDSATGKLGGTVNQGFNWAGVSAARRLTSGSGERKVPKEFIRIEEDYILPESYRSICSSAATVLAIDNNGQLYYWGMDPRVKMFKSSYVFMEDIAKFTDNTEYLQHYTTTPTLLDSGDWKKVVPAGIRNAGFMLLKSDGTVWILGHINDYRVTSLISNVGVVGFEETIPFRAPVRSSATYSNPTLGTSIEQVASTVWQVYLDYKISFLNTEPTNYIKIYFYNPDPLTYDTRIIVRDQILTFSNFQATRVYIKHTGTTPNRRFYCLMPGISYDGYYVNGIKQVNASNDTVTISTPSSNTHVTTGMSFTLSEPIGGLLADTLYFIRTVSAPVVDSLNSDWYNVNCTVSLNPGGSAVNITSTVIYENFVNPFASFNEMCYEVIFYETFATNTFLDVRLVATTAGTRDTEGNPLSTKYISFESLVTHDADIVSQTQGPASATAWPNYISSTDDNNHGNSVRFTVSRSATADTGTSQHKMHFDTLTRLFSSISDFIDITYSPDVTYDDNDFRSAGQVGHHFYGIRSAPFPGFSNPYLVAAGSLKSITSSAANSSYVVRSGVNLLSQVNPTTRTTNIDWAYLDGQDGVWSALTDDGTLFSWGDEMSRSYTYRQGTIKNTQTITVDSYRYGALARGINADPTLFLEEDIPSLTSVKFKKVINRGRIGVGLGRDGIVYTWGGPELGTGNAEKLALYYYSTNYTVRLYEPTPVVSEVIVTACSSGIFTASWPSGSIIRNIGVGCPIYFKTNLGGIVVPYKKYYVRTWSATSSQVTFTIKNIFESSTNSISSSTTIPLGTETNCVAGLYRCCDIWGDGQTFQALDQDTQTIYTWGHSHRIIPFGAIGVSSSNRMSVKRSGAAGIIGPATDSPNPHVLGLRNFFLRR